MIKKILKYVSFPVIVSAIVGVTLYVENGRDENREVRQELRESESMDSMILLEVRDIKENMATKDQVNAVQEQNRAELDYFMRHVNDPIEDIQRDLNDFRRAWDADQEAKKNYVSGQTR